MNEPIGQDVKVAIQRSGVDLDVFDFYRSCDEYGMTRCPCCSQWADLHRLVGGVILECTKCSAYVEWECDFRRTELGGTGSITLMRAIRPNLVTDEPANDNKALTNYDAAAIAEECIAAVNWQTEFKLNSDNGPLDPKALMEATRAKHPATIKLIESWDIGGDWPPPIKPKVVLLATTVRSIADTLRDQGYGSEASRIYESLDRCDAAARTH